jgi:sec-independent protein translocase protein TatC
MLSTNLYNHSKEIHLRFYYILFSFVFTFFVACFFSLEFLYLMVYPLLDFHTTFMFTDLTEAFHTTIQVCFLSSFFLLVPFFFYQIWCFLVPSLFFSERKKITIFCCFLVFFFFLGWFVVYFFLLPQIYEFLITFEIKSTVVTLQLQARIQSYVSLVSRIFFIFILVYPIPLFIYFLYKRNILLPEYLSENRRFLFLLSVLTGSFLSPPDVFSQLSICVFFLVVFELMIWLGFFLFFYKKTKKNQEKKEA